MFGIQIPFIPSSLSGMNANWDHFLTNEGRSCLAWAAKNMPNVLRCFKLLFILTRVFLAMQGLFLDVYVYVCGMFRRGYLISMFVGLLSSWGQPVKRSIS